MRFVPIPGKLEILNELFPIWFPFLKDISRRSKEPVLDLMRQIASREVQIALVWDRDVARALVGLRFRQRGPDLIGEIVWLTGKGMHEWRHLLPEMENYLKQRGCAEIKPICRPGWSRFLKQRGFRTTHLVMEKKL